MTEIKEPVRRYDAEPLREPIAPGPGERSPATAPEPLPAAPERVGEPVPA